MARPVPAPDPTNKELRSQTGRTPMIQWTAEQFERYKLLEHHLRPAHARAAQALITLARLRPGQMQYERVCNELVDVGDSIGLLIAGCETIKASGFQPKFTRINVLQRYTCDFCLAHPEIRQRDEYNSLEPDPAWGIVVETLLRLTALASLHSGEQRYSSPHILKKSSRGLADLNKLFLREQRHLRNLELEIVPKIAVVDDRHDFCPDCGHRVSNTSCEGTGHTVDVSWSEMLEEAR